MKVLVISNIKFKQDRTNLEKILHHNGFRPINSSTYFGELSNNQLLLLKNEINEISKDNDSIIVIPLCKSCTEKIKVFGEKILDEDKYVIL